MNYGNYLFSVYMYPFTPSICKISGIGVNRENRGRGKKLNMETNFYFLVYMYPLNQSGKSREREKMKN